MEPRISIVTLGVEDLDRAVRFYEAMGLKRNQRVTDGVAFFQMGGTILALWFREELAKDAGLDGLPLANVGTARPASALAYNTRSDDEVGAVLERAKAAGGAIVKPAQKAFWGGWYGYFADTEGNLWEVAHNPDFPIDAEGNISLPV
ncbi:VOC family protein [Mesorhizobium sp. LHD-90]|uniref:VOC family protein n=1 Tax=Mesorhizobium sp. LHD-90 TaxID=3071414 RepID=UPI0027E0CF23|nr:VOC family protein [Mesorhizobium sp. LHD-90]MDQ6438240.1 VOC family protein [Mesorhizobium sp. LHD-90]